MTLTGVGYGGAVDNPANALCQIVAALKGPDGAKELTGMLQALGIEVPTFAHLSMIWGPDGKRLSKRHGATSVEAYAELGYLPLRFRQAHTRSAANPSGSAVRSRRAASGIAAEPRNADLVSVGGYVVVHATNWSGHPIGPPNAQGPWEAVQEFLRTDDRFQVDRTRERFIITLMPSGYLKRVK